MIVFITELYISLDTDNELNFSSSLNNLEHCIAGRIMQIAYWQILENMIISLQFVTNYIGYLLDSASTSRFY